MRRSYDRRVRLPRSLVEELARTTSLAQPEWVAARAASDFARFRPWLEKIIQLKREESACLARSRPTTGQHAALGLPPARRHGHSSATAVRRSTIPCSTSTSPGPAAPTWPFSSRRCAASWCRWSRRSPKPAGASDPAHSWRGRQPGIPALPAAAAILNRFYPRDRQQVFGEAVAAAVGFDFRRGRLDVTAHPFCSGIGPGDCRITTRYDEHNFSDAFFGILHEVGHGLYEQGLDPDHYGTPMGEAVSLGRSRVAVAALGECRGPQPSVLELLVSDGPADLPRGPGRRDARRVPRRGQPCRPVADPRPGRRGRPTTCTSSSASSSSRHCSSGDLAVADLPAAWNQKYEEALGVKPANDAEGCLQDIHWSAGLIGYFPTYTLGNLYAAQLFAAGPGRARAGSIKPSHGVTLAACSAGCARRFTAKASAVGPRT